MKRVTRTMVQKAYDLLDASGCFGVDRYEGGHLFRGTESIPWLVEQLGKA